MREIRTTLAALLCGAMLLTGCGKAHAPAAAPLPAGDAAASGPAEVQAPEAPADGNPEAGASEMRAEVAVPDHGMLIHMERMSKEAYDPEAGTTRILTFAWDNVRVDSDLYPEAARRMTEELAAMQDVWYTGSGSEEGSIYGYNAMLAAAEDNYAISKEYEGIPSELSSTRYVTVLRADDEICVFLVTTYDYLGGPHGGYADEAVCFDARTGERLHLENLSASPEEFRERLVSEMLRLAAEDKDGYYSGQLSLTAPENYETAFRALLRDGAWYPGEDAFHLTSDLYELGDYASGLTDFSIPYENLDGVLDGRWLPRAADSAAGVRMIEMAELQEGSLDIVDQVVIGDGGETGLLVFSGDARDVSLWTAYPGTDMHFYPEQELFFCGRLCDCALQLALLFPGDLPDTMLRYRDAEGEHEYLIGLSGENGRIILTANPSVNQD